MEGSENPNEDLGLVGMGLRVSVSPAQNAFYIILVMLGILGNATVVVVIGKSVIMDHGGGQNSDIIIINMALSNLMVSLMRNTLLVISDMGLELYSSKEWCQFLMGVWVWLRSVNVWSTLYLSAFHFQTLRRVAPNSGNLHGPRSPPTTLLLSMALIWLLNFIYSIPAHIFSTNGNVNTTETLMLVSSTTRPLLGCVWDFPSTYSGLAYATTSIVIHETLPIILMAITNMGSLYTLYTHGRMRSSVQDGPVIKRVPAERRAAKVILALIMLFIASWGTSIISVNYFNYNQGSSANFLLIIARFANIIFIAMSPAILAVGHRRLRSTVKSLLSH
ncbi:olfactory receptor class A-like protein 4 [Hippoglossus hippoglossus]|uniref:olfactory receptor class A-like protein 4 n=1 Tax=Hippoglossus hippoglossus TaxID=8267 RepID=UPI00148C4FB6|nr:olfactory receptor class A-like protein 4 [Hippoglossus hippoglossus]XP_034442010.1 olfactory receptor class A-like protein 4 [Hippoglossus hippoglossus]XP_034442011.1 olfactory receptor class A-like protein 4 [Hippoglossus hippoglossus]